MIVDHGVGSFAVHEDEPIVTALRRITDNRFRTLLVVRGDGTLVGTLTDGDVRRWLVGQAAPSLDVACSLVARRDCRWARMDAPAAEVESLFGRGVDLVPLLDDRGHVVGVARPRTRALHIDGRRIAADEPAFLIAEIGINHNGSLDQALRLIDAAADAGADCAKFQLRDLGALYRSSAHGLAGEDLGAQYTLDLLQETELGVDDMLKALDHVRAAGMVPLCTAWDHASADVLVEYGLPAFKVASADLTNHDLIIALAETGRPLLVSTGMSTEDEIRETVELLRKTPSPYALLQCQSSYPAPFKDLNLRYMNRLAELGGCVVGYSGHERGFHVAVAAVALGASIIEKHITLDRGARGNDHRVSLEPDEFGRMVREIREVEEALGSDRPRQLTQGEALNRQSLAKSLVATRDLPAGHLVTAGDLTVRSPGRGLQPNARHRLLGVRLHRAVAAGDFFYPFDLDPGATGPRRYHFRRPWGIPVRFHDWRAMAARTNPDFVEFHLSYRDLEVDADAAVPERVPLGFTVHAPDLFLGDHLLDLASTDDEARRRSVRELQRVVDLARDLTPRFDGTDRPLVVVSVGGASLDGPLPESERPRLYDRCAQALAEVDVDGVELIAQTLPPYPWHVGGQRYWNLFVDARETADFCRSVGMRVCLDVSHTRLAATAAGTSFAEAVEVLAPLTAHLHLADASGVDGEGTQIGEGDIDWAALCAQLDRLAPEAGFIPEIWQGHVSEGHGFWVALDRLEQRFGVSDG